jgi:hypothetical protein
MRWRVTVMMVMIAPTALVGGCHRDQTPLVIPAGTRISVKVDRISDGIAGAVIAAREPQGTGSFEKAERAVVIGLEAERCTVSLPLTHDVSTGRYYGSRADMSCGTREPKELEVVVVGNDGKNGIQQLVVGEPVTFFLTKSAPRQ